jgi:hypothetical protein
MYRNYNKINLTNFNYRQGHLEIWNSKNTHCIQRIATLFNRMSIFTVFDDVYHGHPVRLQVPNNTLARYALQLVYYTKEKGLPYSPHNTHDIYDRVLESYYDSLTDDVTVNKHMMGDTSVEYSHDGVLSSHNSDKNSPNSVKDVIRDSSSQLRKYNNLHAAIFQAPCPRNTPGNINFDFCGNISRQTAGVAQQLVCECNYKYDSW